MLKKVAYIKKYDVLIYSYFDIPTQLNGSQADIKYAQSNNTQETTSKQTESNTTDQCPEPLPSGTLTESDYQRSLMIK